MAEKSVNLFVHLVPCWHSVCTVCCQASYHHNHRELNRCPVCRGVVKHMGMPYYDMVDDNLAKSNRELMVAIEQEEETNDQLIRQHGEAVARRYRSVWPIIDLRKLGDALGLPPEVAAAVLQHADRLIKHANLMAFVKP